MEFSPPPICPKCNAPMDSCEMEVVLAPPAPTMYLTKWSCTHKPRKEVQK